MGQILSCHIKFGVVADCAYAYFHHWITIGPSTREFKIVILVSILVSIWAGSTVRVGETHSHVTFIHGHNMYDTHNWQLGYRDCGAQLDNCKFRCRIVSYHLQATRGKCCDAVCDRLHHTIRGINH